jgi:hypothetical protein
MKYVKEFKRRINDWDRTENACNAGEQCPVVRAAKVKVTTANGK